MAPSARVSVDVIIPVYNQRRLVEECIASVLDAKNILSSELVIVDDASTDHELKSWLAGLARTGEITLLTNDVNLGFTKTVNRGMHLHPERDALLLNSDTVVHGDWLDRLHRVAMSDPRIGTVNPLTNASHIGCYPFRTPNGSVAFEITDAQLDALAAAANLGRHVTVQTTVGFCIYIRRPVIQDIGYFDAVHFPLGYGEEIDFCYRARRLGWRHVITGDVFVRHWEGQSYGERKAQLISNMIGIFNRLHSSLAADDRNFAQRDPIRPLREHLDVARLKLLLGGEATLPCFGKDVPHEARAAGPQLIFDVQGSSAQVVVPGSDTLPNLPTHLLPTDIAAFNNLMAQLGVNNLGFKSAADAESFASLLRGRPTDLGVTARIAISGD